MKILILAGALALVSACSSMPSRINKTLDREGENLSVRVHVYRHKYQMDKYTANQDDYLMGEAVYYLNSNDCILHVLYTDNFQETLGHELMHCLYGDFH